MTTSPLDSAPEALGPALRLPAEVRDDPDLVALHQEWVNKLKAEAMGLPMHTVQQFLLERIATLYVMIRYRELHDPVEEPEDESLRDRRLRVESAMAREKESHATWLALVREWNKVLATGNEQLRDAVLAEAEKIALDAVALVEDTTVRQTLRRHFKERFAAIGY